MSYPSGETRSLLEPFRVLAEDRDFWNYTSEGLAVLGATGFFNVLKLQRPVSELAVAADSFHLKPLLRILQSADRYQVLCLNGRDIQLFEGNRDYMGEIELAPGIPRTITETLSKDRSEPHQRVTSHPGPRQSTSLHHGHGSKQDVVDTDVERFFRAVDRSILEHHSRPTGLPLILAALTEYHAPFRQVSRNPFLVDHAIEGDTKQLAIEHLRQRAWAIMEPEYRTRLAKLIGLFQEACSKGLGSDSLSAVSEAAAQSRIETLLVDAERRIPGRLDRTSGSIRSRGREDRSVDDLLDDVAELALNKGGEVIVVPSADMPTTSGVAASYRF